MTPDELFKEFTNSFQQRKFAAGLLVAFIDFLEALETPSLALSSFDGFLNRFRRQTRTAQGARANTLIVDRGGGRTLSIRPFYNRAERYFRSERKRFDYPSCAPHATQAWTDYLAWLDALVTYSNQELAALRQRVCDFVLTELPSQEFDPSSIPLDPPLFQMVLQGFDLARHKHELSGAAFQGIVFGFLRADNPHLQMEVDKVRTASKRLQRVGDVDGWDGGRLAVSAEVKQYALADEALPQFAPFADAVARRGAIGIVAALGFAGSLRERLEDLGLLPVSPEDMVRILGLWDSVKQRTAVTSLFYYVRHVEKNAVLTARLEKFVETATSEWTQSRLSAGAA